MWTFGLAATGDGGAAFVGGARLPMHVFARVVLAAAVGKVGLHCGIRTKREEVVPKYCGEPKVRVM